MLDTPGPLRRNSIRLRSGHQVGWLDACPSGVNVSRVWPVPAAVIRDTSKFVRWPGLRMRYAMSRPSGAQSDWASSSGLVVSRRRSVPSWLMLKMSPTSPAGLVRKLENAMRPLKTSACAAVGTARTDPAASAARARDLMSTPSGFGEVDVLRGNGSGQEWLRDSAP